MERLWFSTGVALKIDGVVYRPSICYEVPPLAKRALDKLAEQGKVKFHYEEVIFVNGIAITKTKKQNNVITQIITPVALPVEQVVENEKKTGRKQKNWNPKF